MTAIASRPVPVARLSEAALPPVDPSIPPWPGEKVRVGGQDLFVRRTPGPPGGGEPVLYVAGDTIWCDGRKISLLDEGPRLAQTPLPSSSA